MTEDAILENFNGDVIERRSTPPTQAELEAIAAERGCIVWVAVLHNVEGLVAYPPDEDEGHDGQGHPAKGQ